MRDGPVRNNRLEMNQVLEISPEVVSFFEFLFADLEILSQSRKATP